MVLPFNSHQSINFNGTIYFIFLLYKLFSPEFGVIPAGGVRVGQGQSVQLTGVTSFPFDGGGSVLHLYVNTGNKFGTGGVVRDVRVAGYSPYVTAADMLEALCYLCCRTVANMLISDSQLSYKLVFVKGNARQQSARKLSLKLTGRNDAKLADLLAWLVKIINS